MQRSLGRTSASSPRDGCVSYFTSDKSHYLMISHPLYRTLSAVGGGASLNHCDELINMTSKSATINRAYDQIVAVVCVLF